MTDTEKKTPVCSSNETKPMTEEERIANVDLQIEHLIKQFDDPAMEFEGKMSALVLIPHVLPHDLIGQSKRADRLFGRIPIELYERVLDPERVEYAYFCSVHPLILHILAFQVKCTSPEVYMKFKPLLPNILKASNSKSGKGEHTALMYLDLSTIITFCVNQTGEGRYVYEALRYSTAFFFSQREKLDVPMFLNATRVLINKIYLQASIERTDSLDKRGWPFAILSIVRNLMRERTEKFPQEHRDVMWDIISGMTRIVGIQWFNLDKGFAKLTIQMNHVELQMALHDVENIEFIAFCRHMRVLELYTTAICEESMFGEDDMDEVARTVVDSIQFLLKFWVEAHLQKIEIPDQVNLPIFNYAVYLFNNNDLLITDDKLRRNIGSVMIKNCSKVLDKAGKSDLVGDVGTLFDDMFLKFPEFEVLDDQIPLLMIQYLLKIRCAVDYEGWKKKMLDCKSCATNLRGRVDWYSSKTIAEAKELLPQFTPPEQHELRRLTSIFDKLPRVH